MRKRNPYIIKRKRASGQIVHVVRWFEPSGTLAEKSIGPLWKADKFRKVKEAELNDVWMVSPESPPLTFEKAKEEYLSDAKVRLEKESYNIAVWVLDRFGRYMKPSLLAEIDVAMIQGYMKRRLGTDGVGPSTFKKDWRTLKAIWNWWKARDYISMNPVEKVVPPRCPEKEKTVLTSQQVEKLLEVCKTNAELHLFVALAVETGLRITELANLEAADVDFEEGLMRVRVKKNWQPKGKKERLVAIGNESRQQLLKLRDVNLPYILARSHRDAWKRRIRQALPEACVKAAVPSIYPHDLRRTAGTLMAEAGVPQDVIQCVLGHECYQTTRDYYIRIDKEAAARTALAMRQRN